VTRRIEVDHLSRVEGHGRIRVEIDGDEIKRIEFGLMEGPRWFESVVLGRSCEDVSSLVCRICAICSVGHKVTSLLALEDALGVEPSEQTKLLRELHSHGMFMESHSLHIYFLALPDFLGAGSVVELLPEHEAAVARALELKKLANDVQETIGGRAIHPENPVIGGFGRAPSKDDLERLRAALSDKLPDAVETVRLFAGLDYPGFTRMPTTFCAVRPEGAGFGYFGRSIAVTGAEDVPAKDYKKLVVERTVPHTTAKQSTVEGGDQPFMVGALARVNHFYQGLTPKAMEELDRSGVTIPSDNSLHNNFAQAVEFLYSLERSIEIIDTLLDGGYEPEEPVKYEPRAGHGVAATEVPRGTLYHEYELDSEGRVVAANIITPTAQNQANIERDMRRCVELGINLSDAELTAELEMIARAYDPCISCAVHLVEVVRK